MSNNFTCGNSSIAGASFTLYPMSDDFVDIILGALKEVDSSKVWMETDDVTTTIRGKLCHVFDVTQAIFLQAAKTGLHVGFQATYSIGCPGDSTGDVFMAEDDVRMNAELIQEIKQPIAAKFSLYPLGGGNYMKTIYDQIETMREYVTVSKSHYSTKLNGESQNIFKGLESVFRATIDSGSNHTVMTVTISANSPSHS